MRYADSYADCCPPDSSREDAREDAVDAEAGRIYEDNERAIEIVAEAIMANADEFRDTINIEGETPTEVLAAVLLVLRDCYRVLHGYDLYDAARVMERLKTLSNGALEVVEKAVSDAAELEIDE